MPFVVIKCSSVLYFYVLKIKNFSDYRCTDISENALSGQLLKYFSSNLTSWEWWTRWKISPGHWSDWKTAWTFLWSRNDGRLLLNATPRRFNALQMINEISHGRLKLTRMKHERLKFVRLKTVYCIHKANCTKGWMHTRLNHERLTYPQF